jgi:CRP-like cAMP-binding protein
VASVNRDVTFGARTIAVGDEERHERIRFDLTFDPTLDWRDMLEPTQGTADQRGKQFDAGETLFREGDSGSFLFVIQEGSVRLTKRLSGREVTLAEFGQGDFVGEVGVVCDAHSTTATATAPTRCLLVDGPTLADMVAGDAEIGVRLVRGLTERLAASHRQLDWMGRPAPQRVALAIAHHAEREGSRQADGVLLARRLRDLGNAVGVDDGELAEISKALIRERLIRIKKNGILVPDVHRMYEFVNVIARASPSEVEGA